MNILLLVKYSPSFSVHWWLIQLYYDHYKIFLNFIFLSTFISCHSSLWKNLPALPFSNLFLYGPMDSYFIQLIIIHYSHYCWSWNSNTLVTWCKEPTHWKRPWCLERLRASGEGSDRGWDGWMASQAHGHEFKQTPGDSEGQRSLAWWRPWCPKESDTTEQLNNNMFTSGKTKGLVHRKYLNKTKTEVMVLASVWGAFFL